MLDDTVEFQIPDVSLDISEGYFNHIVREHASFTKTIVVRNHMAVKNQEIDGVIFIMLSLDDFLRLVEKMAGTFLDQKQ